MCWVCLTPFRFPFPTPPCLCGGQTPSIPLVRRIDFGGCGDSWWWPPESNENSLLCLAGGSGRGLDLLRHDRRRSRGRIYRLGHVITPSGDSLARLSPRCVQFINATARVIPLFSRSIRRESRRRRRCCYRCPTQRRLITHGD